MAQPRQRHPAPRNRPLSADFAPRTKESSVLYSILPSAVQSRLPRLPSLRRSVSMYGLATRRKSAGSRPASSTSSGTSTPKAGYGNAMVLSGSRTVDEEMMGYFVESLSSDEDLPQTTNKGRHTMELTESKSGIGWKFANQGLNLLSLAVEESSTISQDARFGNAGFARQLYLHALTYLLRALPSDLTTEEQLSVRSSLPPGVVEPLHFQINGGYPSRISPKGGNSPSFLHRTLASSIVQLFILFQFILPYLKYLLSTAYRYDRTHKISERVLSQSIETVDTIGKRGLSFTGAIYGLNDGKFGQAITEAAAWFVEGVTGGIHEGVGEGMAMMGGRKPSQGPTKRR